MHTLLDLHEAIQDAFDFDDDHLYSFFMDAKRYSKNAYESPNCENGAYDDEGIPLGKFASSFRDNKTCPETTHFPAAFLWSGTLDCQNG